MHIEIYDPRPSDEFDIFCNPWMQEGFFVATVGETAVSYLYDRTFRLFELAYCSRITFVNVMYHSYFMDSRSDAKRAKKEYEAHTKELAEKCAKKQLYIMSELDDIYAANQCIELANGNGEEGLSVLITHEKSNQYEYYDQVKNAFNTVICLRDKAEDSAEILRWIICDFTAPGWIGVDYEDARSVLNKTKEGICRKISYPNANEMKAKFRDDFLNQDVITYIHEQEQINRLLGVWVPKDFEPEDFDWLYDEISHTALGDIVISAMYNEKTNDESWTIVMLSGVSEIDSF